MELNALAPDLRKVVGLMAEGYAVKHGKLRFRRGADVPRAGLLTEGDGYAIKVSGAMLDEIEQAGIPLVTYEHNIAEGWKTIIALPDRSRVMTALKH